MQQDVKSDEALKSQLMPMDSALGSLPSLELTDQQIKKLVQGLSLEWPTQTELDSVNPFCPNDNKNQQQLAKLYRLQCGRFIGIGELDQGVSRLSVKRLLSNRLLASFSNTLF